MADFEHLKRLCERRKQIGSVPWIAGNKSSMNAKVEIDRIDCLIVEEVMKLYEKADVRPVVRARWEDETGYIFSVLAQRVYCPACKSYAYFYPQKTKNFCPNCGAYMEGNENG